MLVSCILGLIIGLSLHILLLPILYFMVFVLLPRHMVQLRHIWNSCMRTRVRTNYQLVEILLRRQYKIDLKTTPRENASEERARWSFWASQKQTVCIYYGLDVPCLCRGLTWVLFPFLRFLICSRPRPFSSPIPTSPTTITTVVQHSALRPFDYCSHSSLSQWLFCFISSIISPLILVGVFFCLIRPFRFSCTNVWEDVVFRRSLRLSFDNNQTCVHIAALFFGKKYVLKSSFGYDNIWLHWKKSLLSECW